MKYIESIKSINKKSIIIVLTVIIVIITIIIINITNIMNLEENNEQWLIDEINTNITEQNEIEEKIIEKEKIVIHITGEVVNNGIVKLEEGERIIDAIEKAGGTTEKADLSKVNLAYVLADGQKLYIPSIEEKFEGEYITEGSGENVIIENNLTKKEEKGNKIININTANEQELLNLQGIGESIAKRIVEYRKINGKFNSIEDIKNVSGIGEAKFNKIKNYICVK